jgi:hypothetical protein
MAAGTLAQNTQDTRKLDSLELVLSVLSEGAFSAISSAYLQKISF